MIKSFITGCAAAAFFLLNPGAGTAEVSVNVTLPLPRLIFPAPPGLGVIPGRYVYYAPEIEADVFFFRGAWYRPYRGGWYIANHYNGPWKVIGSRHVPRPVYNMPRDFRRYPPLNVRLPYGEVKRNWSTWEQERRWDQGGKGRSERKEHRGKGPKRGRGGHRHGD